MNKLKEVKVRLNLPYVGGVEGTWQPDESEKNAAWELYIELITRISIAELKPDEGLLREALTSLYNLFGITRDILRKYGSSIARPKNDGYISFGYLAVAILNAVLRPMLSKWHPLLLDYEANKPASLSSFEYEKQWDKNEALRKELNRVRIILSQYADILAEVADVPSLIVERLK
ncbi:MAG: hypothetical protein AAGE84_18400 [Cyanobacteria bacterium P01_G01_bin.39]